MKCHYVYDKEAGKVHIPGCWSAVIHGIEYCSCRDEPEPFTHEEFEKQRYNDRITGLKKENKELEKEVYRLNRIIKKLLNQ